MIKEYQQTARLNHSYACSAAPNHENLYSAYKSLVSPKESMLIVVDRLSDGVAASQALGEENLSRVAGLVDAARRNSVPLVFATREHRHPRGNLNTSFKESISRPDSSCVAALTLGK